MTETRPADPRARRHSIWLLAAAGLFGLLTVTVVPSTVEVWLTQDGAHTRDRIELLLSGLAGFLLLSLCLAAMYLFIVAARIDAAGEFPPPGMALVRETRVLRGEQARGRAWLIRGVGILMVVLAVANAVMMWMLAASF